MIDTIAAYGDGPDWATVCELSDTRARESLQSITKEDSCEAAYGQLERNQAGLVEGQKAPIDDFAALLAEYEVGEATLTDDGAEVELTGPAGPATSFLMLEGGELKVSELFVTPDASTPGSFSLPDNTN
ncbi:MAG: hypothetical protein ACXWZM_09430 [Solirubrobacterales bacterium]